VQWEYSKEAGRTRWVFCHRVDPTRSPHPAAVDLVAELHSVARSVWAGIFRCRACGQHYVHDWQEISNWDSSGEDHPMEYDNWYPISVEEVEILRRNRHHQLSPRLYLRLGL
jgi:hypothetical protein